MLWGMGTVPGQGCKSTTTMLPSPIVHSVHMCCVVLWGHQLGQTLCCMPECCAMAVTRR